MSVSIRDVAKACGVSTYTVSSVINDKGRISDATRERVLGIINDLGYDAARNAPHLRHQKTKRIGLVMPFGDAPSSSFYYRALSSAKSSSIRARLDLTVYSEQEIIDILDDDNPHGRAELQVDSLVFFAPKMKRWRRLVKKVITWDIPVAVVRRQCDIKGAFCINDDDQAAIHTLTEHLIQQGHQHIGFIEFGNPQSDLCVRRRSGYLNALNDAGIQFNESLILPFGGYGKKPVVNMREHAGSIIKALHNRNIPISAIIIPNDGLVGHLIGSLQKEHFDVPSDIAIAGYGNEPICEQLYPSITSAIMPIEEMVAQAVECLSKPSKQLIKSFTFENKLIKRQST